MAVSNQAQLLSVLESGEYKAILGTAECVWLDFKQAAYGAMEGKPKRLSRKGQFELAKDVAALANKQGGALLLGIREKLSPTSGAAVADSIAPIKVAAIDLSHYKQVLMAQIYPVVDGIAMTWYLTDLDEREGILAIVVPKRRGKHHIVRNPADDDGNHLPGIVIPERIDDHIYTYPAEGVYGLLASLTDVAVKSDSQLQDDHELYRSIDRAPTDITKKAETVRAQLISSNNWDDDPVLVVQSAPIAGPSRLDNFFDEVKQSFVDTKPARSMGFNLNSLGIGTDTVEGAFVKSGVRDASIRLDPDGMLTLAVKASPDFLGWAVNKDRDELGGLKMNSIVLIELTFEFARYINETLTKHGLGNWRYFIDARNFKKSAVALYAGGPGSLNSYHGVQASKDKWTQTVHTSKDYSKDTFQILTEIYALFMLPPSAIPYATDGKITKQSILNLNNNVNGY